MPVSHCRSPLNRPVNHEPSPRSSQSPLRRAIKTTKNKVLDSKALALKARVTQDLTSQFTQRDNDMEHEDVENAITTPTQHTIATAIEPIEIVDIREEEVSNKLFEK